MSLNVNAFEQNEFSGGMTDDYIDCSANSYRYAWNFLVTPNKKLVKRPGSTFYNSTYPILSSGGRIGNIIPLGDIILFRSGSEISFIDTTKQNLYGPSGYSPFSGAGENTNVSWSKYYDHIIASSEDYINPVKLCLDADSSPVLYTAGLPDLASDPSPSGASGSNNYLYAFCYAHTYDVETVEYLRIGPVTEVELENVNEPDTGSNLVTISSIPELTNGSNLHYDVDNIVVHVYRTTNNGTLFYKVGEVTNGTTVYEDSTDDDALLSGERLYTTGDVIENDAPPLCKYVHVVNEACYYANVDVDDELIKNRVYQSKLGIFDAVPETFYIDVEDEIKGISSHHSNPIVFCANSIYRLDGTFDNLGRGGISYQRISDTTGCVNHGSIVQTLVGVFFAGNNGFYWTDGYTVRKISDGLNETYSNITNTTTKQSRIHGAYDNLNRRVYWACQYYSKTNDNDACLVLDTRWPGASQNHKCFTQISGTTFSATAIYFDSGNLIRGDQNGYAYEHDNNLRSDPKVDLTLDASEWPKEAIIQRFLDGARSYGSTFNRKFIPRAQIVAKNVGDIAIRMNAYNDDRTIKREMKEIRALGNFVWGDPNFVWPDFVANTGNTDCVWNKFNIIKQQRRLPASGGLRCLFFQLEVTYEKTILLNSDDTSDATVGQSEKTVTIDNTDFSWPLDCEDYTIYFDDDDYEEGYNIASRDNDEQITIEGTPPSDGSYSWIIKGYGKNHSLKILNLLTHYVPFSMSHDMYDGETGGNE